MNLGYRIENDTWRYNETLYDRKPCSSNGIIAKIDSILNATANTNTTNTPMITGTAHDMYEKNTGNTKYMASIVYWSLCTTGYTQYL